MKVEKRVKSEEEMRKYEDEFELETMKQLRDEYASNLKEVDELGTEIVNGDLEAEELRKQLAQQADVIAALQGGDSD